MKKMMIYATQINSCVKLSSCFQIPGSDFNFPLTPFPQTEFFKLLESLIQFLMWL